MLTSYKIDILSEVGYTKTHISSKIRFKILTDLKQRASFILKPFKNVRGLRLVWAVFSETKSTTTMRIVQGSGKGRTRGIATILKKSICNCLKAIAN